MNQLHFAQMLKEVVELRNISIALLPNTILQSSFEVGG